MPVYLILVLSLSGDGIIFDLSFRINLHSQGVGRLLLSTHLQRKLGHVDLWESSSISKVLQKHRFYSINNNMALVLISIAQLYGYS